MSVNNARQSSSSCNGTRHSGTLGRASYDRPRRFNEVKVVGPSLAGRFLWVSALSVGLFPSGEREKFIYHVRTQQIDIQVRQW